MKKVWITYFVSVVLLPSFALLLGFPLAFIVATSLTGSIPTIIGMSVNEPRLKLAQKILGAGLVSLLWFFVLVVVPLAKGGGFNASDVVREDALNCALIFLLITAGLLVREVGPRTKYQVALGLAAAIWSTTLFSCFASLYWNEGWWLD
jgi:hypothetical protein